MISYWILLFTSVVVASFSQILLKKSALKDHDSILKEYLNPYVIIGYGMMFGATILTVFAFSGLDYKNGPIIESIGYVLVMFLCNVFLHEKITKRKLIGNALIILGIIIFYIQ